jgi:thiamine biosynthesis protein ThiS
VNFDYRSKTIIKGVLVEINGEKQDIGAGETITGLLRSLEIEPERVAVELDRKIVKRAEWDETMLRDGAQLEIVQFVGGG